MTTFKNVCLVDSYYDIFLDAVIRCWCKVVNFNISPHHPPFDWCLIVSIPPFSFHFDNIDTTFTLTALIPPSLWQHKYHFHFDSIDPTTSSSACLLLPSSSHPRLCLRNSYWGETMLFWSNICFHTNFKHCQSVSMNLKQSKSISISFWHFQPISVPILDSFNDIFMVWTNICLKQS